MPRKPPPPPPKKGPRKPLPDELARDAIAHEEEAPGGKVRMTFDETKLVMQCSFSAPPGF